MESFWFPARSDARVLTVFNLIVQDRKEEFYEELALKKQNYSQLLCFICL